ncbi:DUF2207 family protein [Microcella sp.]|uniref:DUF2207 family protein n=1 Tax=Microcella sp. TaxID=1913979 RepID=UPI003918F124
MRPIVALLGLVTAILFGVAAPLGALPGSAPAAHANVDNFVFDSFEAEYVLDRDDEGRATLVTTETLVARFPNVDQNRGIRRTLPATYQGRTTELEVLSVTDERGASRSFFVESDGGVTSVVSAVPEGQFVRGVQTYVITYVQRDTVDAFTNTGAEEFYWNLNGTDWRQPFGEVRGTVRLGPGLAERLTGGAFCYQGVAGSSEWCDITVDGDTITVASTRPLGAFENVTVAIGFTPGTFTLFNPSPLASPAGWGLLLVALLSLGCVIIAISVRSTLLRDEPGRPVIVVEYLPPKGVTLMEAAVLRHRRNRAIASQLVDFAVRRMITIIEHRVRLGRDTWRLQLQSADGATERELRMLRYFFGDELRPGAVHDLKASSTTLSAKLTRLLSDVAIDNANRRHWKKHVPPLASVLPSAAAFLLVFAAFVALAGLADEGRDADWMILVLGGVIVAAVITAGLLARQPLSAAGAEVNDHLTGLDQYIRLAEADRMRVLQSPQGALREPIDPSDRAARLKLTERLLPWAVLFGHEKEWASELGSFYAEGESPPWYRGARPFSVGSFAAGVGSVSSTLSSSYSGTSSSGGSGGGGSSGGGGGGGGGGGV